MPTIRKSIDIEASPENVFKYVTNAATQPDWVTFLQSMDITSGDGQSKGTTDSCVIKIGPRSERVEALWTEYEPPRAFGRKTTSGMEMEGRIALEPQESGTRVEWTVGYKPPLGPIGMVVDALFMNRVMQNEMEESLETLKAQLEG